MMDRTMVTRGGEKKEVVREEDKEAQRNFQEEWLCSLTVLVISLEYTYIKSQAFKFKYMDIYCMLIIP